MNNNLSPIYSSLHASLNTSRPSIPRIPDDQARQLTVSAIETKQQKQLAQTFIIASHQANNMESTTHLQELAELQKKQQGLQVINENSGENLKSLAMQRQEKIANLFEKIQDYK